MSVAAGGAGGGGGPASGDEMRVQTRALRALARLTPARSTRPPTPSTGEQHGQEGLRFGRSTGAVTLPADLTLGI